MSQSDMGEKREKGRIRLGSFSRRRFIWLINGSIGAGLAAKLIWHREEAFWRSPVFVARADSYSSDLEVTLREGLQELGFGRENVRGKKVLLKPNLVEPVATQPHINTHPQLVRAAGAVFRSWDAAKVIVAEGAGHVRDAQMVLENSGMESMLREAEISYVDLNHDDVHEVRNQLKRTNLSRLYLPRSVLATDIVVSMPKMKTHHWVGFTLSMKNLFGIMPGVCYGWPKNLLHYEGISKSILDITATIRPHLAIVDGIIGMEGDGPIMGTPKRAGVLVLGRNFPAVDATSTRLMGYDPYRVEYLYDASGVLGPISETHIEQRGEQLDSFRNHFELLDHSSMNCFRS